MAVYFKLNEFIASSTAKANKLDNTPSTEIKGRIEELMQFLDGVRKEWAVYAQDKKLGTPALNITSGYRCPALNKLVGGKSTSAHLSGYAADIQPANGKIDTFYKFFYQYLKDRNLDFDEIFIETSKKSKWVHFALKSINGLQRKKYGALFV